MYSLSVVIHAAKSATAHNMITLLFDNLVCHPAGMCSRNVTFSPQNRCYFVKTVNP